MDPVTITGLVASVSQLVEYTGKIVKYVNNVKNAPAERNQITKECVSLLGQLNDLRSRAETTDPNDAWFNGLRNLAGEIGPLEQYKESLEKIAATLKPAKGAKKYGKMIMWPLSKRDTQDALAHIHRLQTLIAAALAQDHFTLSLAIKHKLDEVSSTSTDLRRQQILEWISSMTFGSKQQDHLGRRQPGTGNWFLDEPLFQGWVSGKPAILWCPGIPAAGKTVLASVIIDSLETKTELENARVVYLYFSYKEQNEQTAMNLIRSFLRQIMEKRSKVSPRLRNLHDHFMKTQKQPPIGIWTDVLIEEIASLDALYVVIDAFDESSETNRARQDLVQELRNIVKDTRVRLLITARPVRQPEIDPRRTETLRIHASPEDMKLHLENRIDREERLSRIIRPDPTLRARIVDTIVSKANGMFLAAELHLASLASKHSLSKVRKCLDTIPEDLDGVYNEAMFRIEQQNKDDFQLAQHVLAWITYAYRPLSLLELRHALAIEPDEDVLDQEAMPDGMTLVDICAGLVTIDEASRVIRLVHYTTQDYFQRRWMTRFPDTQKYITNTCLNYLLLGMFQNGCSSSRDELRTRNSQFPFFAYAACRWASHLWNAIEDGCVDDDLHIRAMRLLTYRSSFASACQEKYWVEGLFFSSQVRNATIPLQFAIAQGLSRIAQELVQQTSDIDAMGPSCYSALDLAIAKNDQPTIFALLRAGALAHRTNLRGHTSLYRAICLNSTPIIHTLLRQAKSSGMKSTLWHATFRAAVNGENVEAVKLLKDLIDSDISVTPLLYRFLREAVTMDEVGEWKPNEILETISESANVYHFDTKAFLPLLWGPEMEYRNTAVLFTRVTEGLVLFSTELLQRFHFTIMNELANWSVVILPAGEESSVQVALALEARTGEWQSELKSGAICRTSNGDPLSFLSTAPFNSILQNSEMPFRLLHKLSDYPDEIWCIEFSHSGAKLAIAGRRGGIFIYNTDMYTVSQRLNELHDESLPRECNVCNLCWSPDDSKVLATYTDSAVRIWNLEKSTPVAVLDQFRYPATCGAWDPTKPSTVVVGFQDQEYGLSSWSETGCILDDWIEEYWTSDLKFSDDGRLLIVVNKVGVHTYDTETKRKINELIINGALLFSVDITKDSRCMLLNSGGTIFAPALLEIESGEVMRLFNGPAQDGGIIHATFGGANDEYVASGSEDGRVFVWDRESRLLAILKHSPMGAVSDVSWHPKDPTTFASGGDDGCLCIWKKLP